MASSARTRTRSRSTRTSSRTRRTPASSVAKPISIDEVNTNYCHYLHAILAGIITNVVVIVIFLTLKSVVILADLANMVCSSVLFPVVSFYLLWISVHFVASHTYIHQVPRERFYQIKSVLFTYFCSYSSASVSTILLAF